MMPLMILHMRSCVSDTRDFVAESDVENQNLKFRKMCCANGFGSVLI